MKSEKLFRSIGEISDEKIVEADNAVFKSKPSKPIWVRWVSVAAACVAVVVGVIAFNHRGTLPVDREYPDLPMLTVNSETDGTFGFEGYLAYNIGELKNGNPWIENAKIDTLPVFKNTITYDRAGRLVSGGLSADEMTQKARDIAAALGLTVDSVYTNPKAEDLQAEKEKEQSIPSNEAYEPNTTPYEAVAVCGSVEIKVEPNGNVRVFFDFENGVTLPDGYNFGSNDETEQQAKSITQYLIEQYASVVAMKSPALSIFGDYNIYGQRSFSHMAYESGDGLAERILGFNFNQVKFSSNEKGELWIIDIYKNDISQKLGDYPIITAKEARELLVQGHYISNVIYTADTEQFPGEKYISSVELVYRNGNRDEVFMPYYRFLVELPSMQRDNGLKDYGAFYVPAVDGRYLENMPVWDGSFN